MPEIKTRQNQGKPVLNTAQQQMQRSFVKARQEQAAQKQNEQSESPNNYAEEKISRTAEDAVRMGPPWLCGKYARFTKGIMISMVFRRKRICRRNIKRHLQKGLPGAVLQHSRKRGEKQRYKESSSNSGQMQREVSRKAPMLVSPHCPKANSHP